MKSESTETSGKLIKAKKTRNERFSVFAICLILAMLIWILIKISETHTTTIEYPLEYVNLSTDKVLVNKSDSIIILKVEAFGYKLISEKYFQKHNPIVIDFKKLKLKKSIKHCYSSYIVTSQILNQISSQLNYSSELQSISPDTLFLELEDFMQKKLPVKLNLDVNFEKQHHLYSPITYSPDSVIVKGPYSVISKLEYVQTELSKLENLKDDKTISLEIQNPAAKSLVNLSNTKIVIELDIEEFTEADFDITVDYIPIDTGNKKNIRIKTFPDKVNVVFLVALKDYKSINESMFNAAVNCSDISQVENNRLKVKLTKFPDKVKISRIEPEAVEYIIMK